MTITSVKQSISKIMDKIKATLVGITSSPSTTLEIRLDVWEEHHTNRALGQMVFVRQKEDGKEILSVGQIVSVTTNNRWHEDPSFKGVIKRYGKLPHLSGTADNRLAVISVQSSFECEQDEPRSHILGISPSTGLEVKKMNNDIMHELVKHHNQAISYIGRVYGTDIDLPMWFKHFDKDNDKSIPGLGAGDAYHIGVFGKTGSGKTVTAALALLAYSKNKNDMNILVLDPQKQFTLDRELLPNGKKLQYAVEANGMEFQSYNLTGDVFLPGDSPEDAQLFADLLVGNDFVRTAFDLTSEDKQHAMGESIANYIVGRMNNPEFKLSKQQPQELLTAMLERFSTPMAEEGEAGFSSYVKRVYTQKNYRDNLVGAINRLVKSAGSDYTQNVAFAKWQEIFRFFSQARPDGNDKISMADIVNKIVSTKKGNFIVLDMSPQAGRLENENLQALFLNMIERNIAHVGGMLYSRGEKTNCLIVMDEAHRYVDRRSSNDRIRELSKEIIGSVRTTRKYGIGHMFITQSLESMDDEITKQMRIFAFGHGLTTGAESRKVGEIINNPAALDLYKSFIDPGNRKQYPFMFFGPMSPFSATGSPLFLETYTDYNDYVKKNT